MQTGSLGAMMAGGPPTEGQERRRRAHRALSLKVCGRLELAMRLECVWTGVLAESDCPRSRDVTPPAVAKRRHGELRRQCLQLWRVSAGVVLGCRPRRKLADSLLAAGAHEQRCEEEFAFAGRLLNRTLDGGRRGRRITGGHPWLGMPGRRGASGIVRASSACPAWSPHGHVVCTHAFVLRTGPVSWPRSPKHLLGFIPGMRDARPPPDVLNLWGSGADVKFIACPPIARPIDFDVLREADRGGDEYVIRKLRGSCLCASCKFLRAAWARSVEPERRTESCPGVAPETDMRASVARRSVNFGPILSDSRNLPKCGACWPTLALESTQVLQKFARCLPKSERIMPK